MKLFRPLAILLTVVAAGASWGADPLRMDVQPTFSGPQADSSVVTVSLENDGPDARGVLEVSGMSGPVSYPVELPRGARKQVLTFPGQGWGVVDYVLRTDQGTLVHHMPPTFAPENPGGAAAFIGDDSGGLAFLRRQVTPNRGPAGFPPTSTRDAYVKPEDAPGRPVAYQGFTSIVLGPGAERMSDETVAALRDYALGGGTVLVLGGASVPLLEDPRWAPYLPGRGWKPKTLAVNPELAKEGGAPLPGPFTVIAPEILAPGATRQGSLATQRPYGLGHIVVLGYSPLESPLSAWEGRARALLPYLRTGDALRACAVTQAYLTANPGEDASTVVMVPSSGPGFMRPPRPAHPLIGPSGVESDPFSTKLPDTSVVFGILALYFVLVVPVSFLLLRRMRRGELAWITAPVLALGFAGLLFKSAQSLYAASLSTVSQGLLVIQEGGPSATFFGTSEIFFPRGGTYDLGLRDVDRLTGVPRYRYGGFGFRPGTEGLEGFNPIDVGTMQVPNLEANNLAFRELSYTQRVPTSGWFTFQRVDARHLRVTNGSPYAFEGRLDNGVYEAPPMTLEPGQSQTVALKQGFEVSANGTLPPNDTRNFTRETGRIALTGELKGFRPGPQVGKEVPGKSSVHLIAFAEATL